MKIGVPKEIKPQEHRIGLTPDSVKILTSNGNQVFFEKDGGFEAGFDDDQYKKAGAKIVNRAEDIFNDSEIIVKVKEPLSEEVKMIRENQIVFTYLHLAAAKELTQGLINSKSICIAYETVTDNNGRLPLLAPMSAVAGRMSVQAGAHCLEKNQKGRGILLGGAPEVDPGNVVILGGGVSSRLYEEIREKEALAYTVSVDSVSHGRISTTHDSSGNGAGSQTLSGISTITSTPGTSDTQFFFNTITESQHSSTRQSILTFTFADGRTDELTIKMLGSDDSGGGDPGGPPAP